MISCALDPSASGAVPATIVIPVLVNYIGDRIGVRQVSHPDPTVAGEGSRELRL